MNDRNLAELSINTIRCLSMDAVQKANSGHPGTPMALAPAAYVLWKNFLKHNPHNHHWFDRDRFVLSNGHASMLLYSLLYLTGYELSLDDIKNFRQWESITPGHPEFEITPAVETTTGPLGQGCMTAVGMAIAEAHLAANFNRAGHNMVDHYTYVFCSDGDFMEGASHEAASLAGHLGLGKLIYLYDDNHISIEGDTELTFSEDVKKRFESYRWHVQDLGDQADDLEAIASAFESAKDEKEKPSLIILRTHIGYGAPNKQDTPDAHGSPLGEEEIKKTKQFYNWPEDEIFLVPEEALQHMREAVERGKKLEADWRDKLENYKKVHPELAEKFQNILSENLPEGWDKEIPHFEPSEGPMATRAVSGKVINAIADKLPWLMGGSGDLEPSTKTLIKNSSYIARHDFKGRNIAWGVREHAMCAASSGMALHKGVRPYASTFFIFTDYARPAIRLAAVMGLPVIYVMTHDSIGLGEDGPTHQPIEQLASFRAMPKMCTIRPADANEAAYAWRAAILRKDGPTLLVLSRQNLPIFDRGKLESAEGVLKGAYILSREKGTSPDILLMASGSEVQLIVHAQEKLAEEGIDARVISMPSWELFEQQLFDYKNDIFPVKVKARLAVEAGSPLGWCKYTGDQGDVIGITTFGSSAPAGENFRHYGFTVENVVKKARQLLK